jgi:beta-galactosidase
MSRLLALAACLLLASAVFAAPVPKGEKPGPAFLDLSAHTNHNLKDDFNSGRYPGNNLASLPAGKQTFAGVKFHIGKGLMQLGSSNVKGKPEKIEGIKVGRKLERLHFLHATCFSAPDATVIGNYVIHYVDKTKTEVEVVYGKDVVDWWAYSWQKAPTRGKAAWEGENEPAKGFDAKIKLYLMSWKNPHPARKVVSLDYVSTAPETGAAPFCVAITAEDK